MRRLLGTRLIETDSAARIAEDSDEEKFCSRNWAGVRCLAGERRFRRRDVVAGELRLGHPLELDGDLVGGVGAAGERYAASDPGSKHELLQHLSSLHA